MLQFKPLCGNVGAKAVVSSGCGKGCLTIARPVFLGGSGKKTTTFSRVPPKIENPRD